MDDATTRTRVAPPSLATVYAALGEVQKTPAGVSWYSRYVNRPLGRMTAAVASSMGLRPNQLTAVSAVLVAAAVVCLVLMRPGVPVAVAVSALLVVGFVIDAADGQLARLQGGGTATGEWFDHVVDAGKGVGIHGGVLVMALRHFDVPVLWVLVPLTFQLITVLVFSGGTVRDLVGRTRTVTKLRPPVVRRWSALMLLPADSGVFGLCFLTLAWPWLFVWVYGALLLANLVIGPMLLAKWYRELGRPADAAGSR